MMREEFIYQVCRPEKNKYSQTKISKPKVIEIRSFETMWNFVGTNTANKTFAFGKSFATVTSHRSEHSLRRKFAKYLKSRKLARKIEINIEKPAFSRTPNI